MARSRGGIDRRRGKSPVEDRYRPECAARRRREKPQQSVAGSADEAAFRGRLVARVCPVVDGKKSGR
ncbi:MAG: hypothetical protein QGH59_03960, partial [Gemmatimonadota bacterium]|nr:hypothetical protein [Gemmatimonadota bacterium]